jgi:hypothetical protein
MAVVYASDFLQWLTDQAAKTDRTNRDSRLAGLRNLQRLLAPESAGAIGENVKALVDWMHTQLDANKSFQRFVGMSGNNVMTPMCLYLQLIARLAETGIRVVHLHSHFLVLIYFGDAASFVGQRTSPSLVLLGPPGTGKSHVVLMYMELAIPDSVQEVRYQSGMADLATVNNVGFVRVFDDVAPDGLGAIDDGKGRSDYDKFQLASGAMRAGETKQMATKKAARTGRARVRTETASVENGRRTVVVAQSDKSGTQIMLSNVPRSTINEALLDRYTILWVQHSKRDDFRSPFSVLLSKHRVDVGQGLASIVAAVRGYVATAKAANPIVDACQEIIRRDQLLHMLLNFGSACGALAAPNLDIASMFIAALTQNLQVRALRSLRLKPSGNWLPHSCCRLCRPSRASRARNHVVATPPCKWSTSLPRNKPFTQSTAWASLPPTPPSPSRSDTSTR